MTAQGKVLMNRKTSLMSAMTVLLSSMVGFAMPDTGFEARREAAKNRPRLVYNNDGGDAYLYPANRPASVAGFLAQRTDQLKKLPVTTISYCTITSSFGQFTHPTRFGEFLTLRHKRPGKQNITADLVALGTDPLREIIKFARANGKEVFWCNRMNDCHDAGHRPDKPYERYSKFKQAHPEYLFGSIGEKLRHGKWSAVDFAQEPVRELVVNFFREVVGNYDVDGVELDFCRHFHIFKSVGRGGRASDAERAMLLDMMRKIRAELDRMGRERGRPVLIAVRAPDSMAYCYEAGLDLERMMKEKLFDIFIGGGYFQLESRHDLVELGRKYNIPVYANLAESRIAGLAPEFKRKSLLVLRGRCAAALEAGMNGIYIFNHFNLLTPSNAFSAELADRTQFMKLNKMYCVTDLDGSAGVYLAGGEKFRRTPLLTPKRPWKLDGRRTTFIECGEPEIPQQLWIMVNVKDPAPELAVSLNAQPGVLKKIEGGVQYYRLPVKALKNRINQIEFNGKATLKDCALLVIHDPDENIEPINRVRNIGDEKK